jgi:hypothetical protein
MTPKQKNRRHQQGVQRKCLGKFKEAKTIGCRLLGSLKEKSLPRQSFSRFRKRYALLSFYEHND